jgi:hypothetical protein
MGQGNSTEANAEPATKTDENAIKETAEDFIAPMERKRSCTDCPCLVHDGFKTAIIHSFSLVYKIQLIYII